MIAVLLASALGMAPPPGEPLNADVRPLLERACLRCHGPERQKAGLRIDDRAALLRGGDSGDPAIVPGHPDESPLLERLMTDEATFRMPPQGERLAPAEVEQIRRWIDAGAPWPESAHGAPPASTELSINDADRDHWSFRPLRPVPLPKVVDRAWVRTPIDAFILARLEADGMTPAPEASRAVLLRRITFDLTGLPPIPEDVSTFASDPKMDETTVDRLLASPRFGERWARHWLDLARYADSDGFEADGDRPGAYHYRDWVVAAINEDLPFDQFVGRQVAGDELAPDDPEAAVATGFLAAGPHLETKNGTPAEREQYQYDEWDDQLSTVGSALLGLTVGCARCHDHKYDPIPTRDYYRMLAAFTTTGRSSRPVPGSSTPALVLADAAADPAPTYLLRRGHPAHKAEPVALGFLGVLSRSDPEVSRPAGATSTHQRAALARWLTDPEGGAGALVARVIVNRLWQHHFGTGLVRTPNDFGLKGSPPSHPELLDWLAGELVRGGWKLKPIHRLIVTSSVYRQGDHRDPTRDPDGRRFGGRAPRRLEAEALRDALLFVSGALDERIGGPAVKPALPPEAMSGRNKDDVVPRPEADGPEQWRRSLYLFTKRSIPNPLLVAFDAPDAAASCGQRSQATVATQALALLNDRFVRGQAERLAHRVEGDANPAARAFALALGRPPTPDEAARSARFLAGGDPEARLINYCQVLFGLNEFIYID